MRSHGNKRTLVAGGAGFLGSHLCGRLLVDGREVLCLDNFFSASEQNIRHLVDAPGFTLLRRVVTQPPDSALDRYYEQRLLKSTNSANSTRGSAATPE